MWVEIWLQECCGGVMAIVDHENGKGSGAGGYPDCCKRAADMSVEG